MGDIGYTATEAAQLAGTTYRKVDYWCRKGVLGARLAETNGSGSGRERSLTAVDVAVAAVVEQVSEAFRDGQGPGIGSVRVFTKVASEARFWFERGDSSELRVQVKDGVYLHIEPRTVVQSLVCLTSVPVPGQRPVSAATSP